MTPLENLLAKLPDAKKSGNGWSHRCPAHDDQKASLSVSEGDDGRALLYCHAKCSTEAIVTALGLSLADLMPAKDARPQPKPKPASATYATANDAVAALERTLGPRSAVWTYHDAHGVPVGLVVRWDQAGGKTIRPVALAGDRWRIGAMPTPHPLYELPALASSGRVIVTEGEKAADAARAIGFTATTSVGGCKAAGKADWRPLAGKGSLDSALQRPSRTEVRRRPYQAPASLPHASILVV